MEKRDPAIRVVLLPRDTNERGTIFGGVILSHIDLAGTFEARKLSHHRFVTVALTEVEFKEPVHVGDVVSFYFNLPYYQEARNREELTRALVVSLEQGRMPPSSVISGLKERNVAFLMPDHLAEPLATSVPTRAVVAGTMLTVFEKDSQMVAHLDECGVGGV